MPNPLESTYRPIRRVAPPDVPIAGVLAAEGDSTVLLADVESVPTTWWRDEEAAHLLAPVDVARRADGHDAVLPWCVVTVGSYLRARAGEALTGGEGVTLAVSLMRGCAEAALPARFGDEPVAVPHGRWWLTDHGRPLFAVGEGSSAREETAELLGLLAGSCSDRVIARLATEAADSIRVRSPAAVLLRLEEAMFEACAPRPLLVRVADPVAVRPVTARELRPESVGDRGAGRAQERFIGTDQADAGRSVSDGVGAGATRWAKRVIAHAVARLRSPRQHSRRTPVLVGVALAAVVLVVGLLWPQSDDGTEKTTVASPDAPSETASGAADRPATVRDGGADAPTGNRTPEAPDEGATTAQQGPAAADGAHQGTQDAQDGTTADAGQPDSTPAPGPGQEAAPTSREAELVAMTAALLGALAVCADEGTCAGLAAEGVDIAQIPDGGVIELVEDFGGVVVMRVVADVGTTSLLSIERVEGAWRVREATPVAG